MVVLDVVLELSLASLVLESESVDESESARGRQRGETLSSARSATP